MKIAFVTLPVTGHLNAMAALALKVQSRRHDVVLLSTLDAKERVLSTGLGSLLPSKCSRDRQSTQGSECSVHRSGTDRTRLCFVSRGRHPTDRSEPLNACLPKIRLLVQGTGGANLER